MATRAELLAGLRLKPDTAEPTTWATYHRPYIRSVFWREWLGNNRKGLLLFAELWQWMLVNAPLAAWRDEATMRAWSGWMVRQVDFLPGSSFTRSEKVLLAEQFFGRGPTSGATGYKYHWAEFWWLLEMDWYRAEALRISRGIPPSGIIGIRSTTGSGFAGAWWAKRSGRNIADPQIVSAQVQLPAYPFETNQQGRVVSLALNPQHQFHKVFVLQIFTYIAGWFGVPNSTVYDWTWACEYEFWRAGQVVWSTRTRWALDGVGGTPWYNGMCVSRFPDLVEAQSAQAHGPPFSTLPQLRPNVLAVRQQMDIPRDFNVPPVHVPVEADLFTATVSIGTVWGLRSGGYMLHVAIHSAATPF